MRTKRGLIAAVCAATLLWTSGLLSTTALAPDMQAEAALRTDNGSASQTDDPVARRESSPEATGQEQWNGTEPASRTIQQAGQEGMLPEPGKEPQAFADEPAASAIATALRPDKPVQEELGPYAGSLPQALDLWLEALSADPRFQGWTNAERQISPLGPGTHGWVVILSRKEQELGYLVVHADKEGRLILSEYGSGPQALFSIKALKQHMQWNGLAELGETAGDSLADGQLQRLYLSPAEALFVMKTDEGSFSVNAKNGEWYQLETALQLEGEPGYVAQANRTVLQAHNGQAMRHARIESLHLPEFDAFERTLWLDGQKLAANRFDELADRLDQGDRVIAVSHALDEILITWPVVGYHLWNGEIPYLIVFDEGERYIPFNPGSMTFYTESETAGS